MSDPLFYQPMREDVFMGPICEIAYPIHVHECVEIVCLTEGKVEMVVEDQRVFLTPGDIAVVFPSMPHGYNAVSEDARGLTLMFPPETIAEFCTPLRTMAPESPILPAGKKDSDMDGLIQQMLRMVNRQRDDLRIGYLHLFLSYLFADMKLAPVSQQRNVSLSCQVLRYLSNHFTEPLCLENTARALGISRIRLSHICSQQLQVGFRQHINALRVNRACTLLMEPNLSIEQIAQQCGYENLRTFNRAFLSQMNMTPRQYRTSKHTNGNAGREEHA